MTPLSVQGQNDEKNPGATETSRPFDLGDQREFERGLTFDEKRRLIRLRSRFALADADCPLPAHPATPFYVKLDRDMTRDLADRLADVGANFIGYYNPHTHMLRADDADELDAIGKILRTEPAVVGTRLQDETDKLTPEAWKFMQSAGDHSGEYEVLFWRDVSAQQARELIVEARAFVVEATVSNNGQPDLRTPLVTVGLNEPGFQSFLNSPLIENIAPHAVKETTNQTSAAMSNATPATININPYNLDGTGQVVGVWDGGPGLDTHDTYQGATAGGPFNNGSSRILKIDNNLGNGGPVGVSDHATHVCGTIIGIGSSDPNIHPVTGNPEGQGYAYRAWCVSHNWDSVHSERRQSKHDWNHVADNHSWSSRTSFGGYNGNTQQFDFDNKDSWLIQVQSAGNYAISSSRPFSDSGMTAYASNSQRNGMVIANLQDNEDINSGSSRGPCADGRLVPHLAANGTGVRSSLSSGNSNYGKKTGTSMSSPSVCGSVTLLSELWRREHNGRMLAPDVIRGVLAITARDKFNVGPDYRYGFGIVDCQAAADLILADKANGRQIVRGAARSSDVIDYEISVTSNAQPLRVVLSWLDVYANTNANPVLVNDLDVELLPPSGGVVYPYSGVTSASDGDEDHTFTISGPNTRDNIELAHVDSPAIGTWTLRVKGTSIPANAQTGFANDVQGYVLVSNHEIGVQKLNYEDPLNTSVPLGIPDDSVTGVTRNFTVSDPRVVTGVRLITRIIHERRGDLEIDLEHPSGLIVNLKTQDSGPEDDFTDVIGVFPDTRQPDADVTAFDCLPVDGVWKVHVRDLGSGNTGTINYLALELDVRTNAAPAADAGADFSVRENQTTQLNGSATVDADGDPITYSWTQISGAVLLNLSSSAIATPVFTTPSVNQDEMVTVELEATDCSGASTTDTVVITIQNNAAPIANAGPDFGLLEGDSGALDASGTTDAENDPLTYAWVQISGAVPITLNDPSAIMPTFTAPTVTQNEQVEFELTVTDDRNDFTTDTVVFSIELNVAPTADAGADIALMWGATGQLDGSGSVEPNNGDSLTYSWAQLSGASAIALSNSGVAQPMFTAPGVDDTVVFELTVMDSRGLLSTDHVTVHVNETGGFPTPNSVGGGGESGGGGCSSSDQSGWIFAVLFMLIGAYFSVRRVRRTDLAAG